jgi:hypothetical protein
MSEKAAPSARWYDDSHLPGNPGWYYWETCDQYGNPRAGLHLWEDGKPACFPTGAGPFKMFGPIPGAMKPWPMVPVS